MNILLNAIPLTEIATGIQRYVRFLYSEMETFADVSVSYLTRSNCRADMPLQAAAGVWSRRDATIRSLPDPLIVALRILDRMIFEFRLRHAARSGKFNIYHEPALFPPQPDQLPTVLTVHDLSLIKHRERHPRERVWFSDLYFKSRLRHAAHIITVSHFTKNELMEEMQIPAGRITAIHLAHGPAIYRRSRRQVERMLEDRGWPQEYILFVGTLEPRKNLSVLIEALSIMKTKVPLLLTGWSGWGDKSWTEKIGRAGLTEQITLTGYVDEETLACLYSGASVFVYPSIYEGFGLPVLEAMACGCPVVCSNRSSLPEVAGGAAILVDPLDSEALAQSLDEILGDSSLRRDCISAGLQRSSQFSWKKAASETCEVFRNISGSS